MRILFKTLLVDYKKSCLHLWVSGFGNSKLTLALLVEGYKYLFGKIERGLPFKQRTGNSSPVFETNLHSIENRSIILEKRLSQCVHNVPVEHNFFVCNRAESTQAFLGAPVMWSVVFAFCLYKFQQGGPSVLTVHPDGY